MMSYQHPGEACPAVEQVERVMSELSLPPRYLFQDGMQMTLLKNSTENHGR